MKRLFFLFLSLFHIPLFVLGQSIPIALPILYENLRRSQLSGTADFSSSFLLKPLNWTILENDSSSSYLKDAFSPRRLIGKKKAFISILPVYSGSQIGGIPYPEASVFLQSKGLQAYLSAGFYGQLGPLSIQLQPEFIYTQNLDYETGFPKSGTTEYLEKFGEGKYARILPGQSSIKLNFGAFAAGFSTENIAWGPGQFNSLLFSNNAFGFEHLTFNTRRPAKTFLGDFEGQFIMGKLQDFYPRVREGIEDWRYLNGISFSYQPRWIKGFYLGISRVFQAYNSTNDKSFSFYFPIIEPLQKEKLVNEDAPIFNTSEYDDREQDQQLTGFVRFVNPASKFELYFEYGRRDHALNWRDATITPEHARAYLFGFQKLIPLADEALFQLRGEVLQQQESISILVKYPGTVGGINWGGHGQLGGFTHLGEMLGPGVGPSSNVQTLEGAWVKGFKKLGLRLERLNRHQDIYIKSFNDPSEQGRWVDLSARILADWQFDNLIISSNINFVNSLNYQWGLAPDSTPKFPRGQNLFSVHSQVSLIYLPKGMKRSRKILSD